MRVSVRNCHHRAGLPGPRSLWKAGEDQHPERDEKLGGTKAPSAVHRKALQKQQGSTKGQLWEAKEVGNPGARVELAPRVQPHTLRPPSLSRWLAPTNLTQANLCQRLFLGNFRGCWDDTPCPVSMHTGEAMNKITSKQICQ